MKKIWIVLMLGSFLGATSCGDMSIPQYGVISVRPYSGDNLPGLNEIMKKDQSLVVVKFRGNRGNEGYLVPLGFALKEPTGKLLGCLYYRNLNTHEEWQGHFDPETGDFTFEPSWEKTFGEDFECEFLFAVEGLITPEWSLVYAHQAFFSADRKGEESHPVTKGVIELKSQ